MSSSKDDKPSLPSQPETPGEIQISLNIIPAAKLHLEFLKQVSKFPGLAEGPLLTQAIHRYVNLWLQLAAKHDTEILPAPLDIQWAWHCHMLCPVMYKKDCMSIVGKVVDFKLFTSQERKKLYPTTQRYWAEAYPNHPLEVRGDNADPRYTTLPHTSYNITEAAGRQKAFYYQVSLPHYRDDGFLARALSKYKQFLFLTLQNPKQFIVPCYDIDLMWHTHQLHPLKYQEYTTRLLGRIFNIDNDWLEIDHDDLMDFNLGPLKVDLAQGGIVYQRDTNTSLLHLVQLC